ncbi:MAG TPA: helix-turn-helix domain-containing protein [Solirubrobacteraceae bacterium]|nr:helix-turn-helix domain-containing protein [Solirubrobacteraceae bacterium]
MPRRTPVTNINDPRYLKAVSHPIRVRILAMLDEGAASPKQLSDRLGVSLGTMAYHVRTLHQLDLLKLVGTRQRRGATEHMYKTVARPSFSDEAWASMEPVAKQRLLGSMLRQIGEYANGSAAAGGFDRSDANISRIALKLDEKGWKQLAAANKKWIAEVQKIEQGVQKRASGPAAEHELFDVGLVMMLFEALPLSEAAAQPVGARRKRPARAT